LSFFDQGLNPMANTLDYKGDPGLYGPESVTWKIMRDVSGFMGGVRALIIQSAHPEVVDGFLQHSTMLKDPITRLSRTSDYVATVTFGAMPEVMGMIKRIQSMHAHVIGTSSRGKQYDANDPYLTAWVHYSLVQSFLLAYQDYGQDTLTPDESNQFVLEQTKTARLLGVNIMLETEAELHQWLNFNSNIGQVESTLLWINFLKNPPISLATKLGYNCLFNAAIASIHPNLLKCFNEKPKRFALLKAQYFVRCLRLAMGESPAMLDAYKRIGRDLPRLSPKYKS
ncbi:MAG: oxygenase MpaB family protein, partial [Candidatus Marinamargulisbacteria bacterium]|nr:oxygenase MpaB family protein [Candidatus Marinamargulisbacteria bacterium]